MRAVCVCMVLVVVVACGGVVCGRTTVHAHDVLAQVKVGSHATNSRQQQQQSSCTHSC
jgi:hypothetical protein